MITSAALAELEKRLQPGESVIWSRSTLPLTAPTAERAFALFFSAGVAFIGAILVLVEGAGILASLAVFALLLVALFAGQNLMAQRKARLPRFHAITDRRLLIFDGRELQSFTPARVTRFDVENCPDGSMDVWWGEEQRSAPARHKEEGGAHGYLRLKRRSNRVGFLGVSPDDRVDLLLREWIEKHQPAPLSAPPSVNQAGEMASGGDWIRVHDSRTGVSVSLPSAWSIRSGNITRRKLLGVVIESPEPRWNPAPDAAPWNRLEAKPGVEGSLVQIDLDNPNLPGDLDAVINSRLPGLIKMTLLDSFPDVQVSGFSGFGVVHAMPRMVTEDEDSITPIDLVQTQYWLRGHGHQLHMIATMPSNFASLAEAATQIMQSIRVSQ